MVPKSRWMSKCQPPWTTPHSWRGPWSKWLGFERTQAMSMVLRGSFHRRYRTISLELLRLLTGLNALTLSATRWVTPIRLPWDKHNVLLFTWKIFISTDLTNIYVMLMERISSRILTYFCWILCLWNHTVCLRCFALTCKLKWDLE